MSNNNLLIIGSGFSFHNMHAFFADSTEIQQKNIAFESWLSETMLSKKLTEDERYQRLLHWENAPSARFCHPREEHLLPLHVCYGMAQRQAEYHYSLKILNKQASMFLWE